MTSATESIVRAYKRWLKNEQALLTTLTGLPEDVARAAIRAMKGRAYTGYWLVHEHLSLGGSPAVICRTKRGKALVLQTLKRFEKRKFV
jgi:hypothetical protein